MNTPVPAFGNVVPPSPQPPAAPAPAPEANPSEQLLLGQMVSKYTKLRDKKAEITKRQADEIKPYSDALNELGTAILDALNKAGVESVRTGSGTAYKSTRSSYTVEDPAMLRHWLEEHDKYDLLETRISKEAIESMIANGESLPPGVKISIHTVANVRK